MNVKKNRKRKDTQLAYVHSKYTPFSLQKRITLRLPVKI